MAKNQFPVAGFNVLPLPRRLHFVARCGRLEPENDARRILTALKRFRSARQQRDEDHRCPWVALHKLGEKISARQLNRER